MIKTAAIALLCGFVGAALYGRLVPSPSPYDYIAVANYTAPDGKPLSGVQMKLVQHRADVMSRAGYVIFNASSLYSYPVELQIPQKISNEVK